ncbi:hypothetical protein N7448_006250 [Penicillium atrosanguineum]|nr:hypothetical protein N7448_006250 [Penicillium atrosanguineum]
MPQLANYLYSDYPAPAIPGRMVNSLRPMIESSSLGSQIPGTLSTFAGHPCNTLQRPLSQLPYNPYNHNYPVSMIPAMSSPLRRLTESTVPGSQITDTASYLTMDTGITAPPLSRPRSPTASLPSNICDEEGSDQSSDDPEFFRCFHCGFDRSVRLDYEGICVYCLEPKQEWCFKGRHESDEAAFKDDEGTHHMYCKKCRGQKEDEQEGKQKEDGQKENENEEGNQEPERKEEQGR